MRWEKQIKETSWYKQAANQKAYYVSTCCKAAMRCLGGRLGFWSFTNNRYMEAFLPRERYIISAENNLKKQKKDKKYIVRIMKECDKKSRTVYNYFKKLENIHGMNLKQVKNALRKLDKLNYEYWVKAYFCDFYDPEGDEMLKNEIEKFGISLNEEELGIMMKTNWKNYVQREMLDLSECKDMKEHARKYFYVNNSWESTTVLTAEDFRKKFNEVEDPKEELRRLKTDWSKEHEKLRKKYDIPKELMDMFFYFRQLFILRDKRKEHTLLINHYYDQLFLRLSKLLKVDFDDMRMILVEDIDKDIRKLSVLRKNLLLEAYDNGKGSVLSGGEGSALYNLLQKSYGNIGSLRGRGVSKGKVEGVVRVILGETHFSKFSEGEIIVAPMTRPEYVPLMKKAIAVVTDEGGITCHAAIISRELGIPCVVGTQKATVKLKDGMLIEVDADKGIVKVVKHMKLLTVQSLVRKEFEKNPHIVRILKEGLLNITATAEKFRPGISKQLGKDVDVNTVGMAIRRFKS